MNLYRRLIRRLGHHPAFAAFARRYGARADRAIYRLTRGRWSPTGTVAPVLLLTTTGRRSGQERTTPVIYVRDGLDLVISSEDFGDAGYRAAWPLNLDAEPRARVQLGDQVLACTARRLPDDEADGVWPKLVEAWPAHATYRSRTGRRHTFALRPEGAGPTASPAAGE